MALRSVVLAPAAPPAAPRRTVVLRVGGPAPKGRVVDLVALIVGIALLLGCVALAQVLPDRSYLNPQFRLSYVDQSQEVATVSHDFLEGSAATFDFTYEIEQDNVNSITVSIFFEDDYAFSNPDRFTLELVDPSGNLVGDQIAFESPRPLQEGTTLVAPDPDYTPVTFAVVEHPSEKIVVGLTHRETKEQVLAREEPQTRVATQGVWTVRVRLLNAGDCPAAQEPEFSGLQAFYCNFGDPNSIDPAATAGRAGGQDPGNPFSIQTFSYSWYTPVIEDLK